MGALNDLAVQVYENSRSKGFWPENPRERHPAEVLMLVVTEVAEAMEDVRDGRDLDKLVTTWMSGPDTQSATFEMSSRDKNTYRVYQGGQRELMDDTKWAELGYVGKPDGVPSELADIIIRVLDACAAWGVDIDEAVRRKMEYNAGREHMHGRLM